MRCCFAYKLSVQWLSILIADEVHRTNVPTTLMRGNLFVTKLLLAFMRVSCGDIVFLRLQGIVTLAVTESAKYEVDPQKISPDYNVEDNVENLIDLAKQYLQVVSDCLPILPLLVSSFIDNDNANSNHSPLPGHFERFSPLCGWRRTKSSLDME